MQDLRYSRPAGPLKALIFRTASFVCDHRNDEQTGAAFSRVKTDAGRLDILINSAWGGYERMVKNGVFTWTLPFHEQPAHRWNAMMDAGVRAAFVCSPRAARIMIGQGCGLS